MHLEGSDPSPSKINDCSASRMLILNVRTRWASTHQMLCMYYIIIIATRVPGLWNVNVGCALDYRGTIDSFVSRNKDLHALELSNADWESIKLVASWLNCFGLRLQRCRPQNYQCYRRLTPSSEAYRMTLKASSAIFPTQSHLVSNLASLARTAS